MPVYLTFGLMYGSKGISLTSLGPDIEYSIGYVNVSTYKTSRLYSDILFILIILGMATTAGYRCRVNRSDARLLKISQVTY
jgi:hypothetical protein